MSAFQMDDPSLERTFRGHRNYITSCSFRYAELGSRCAAHAITRAVTAGSYVIHMLI